MSIRLSPSDILAHRFLQSQVPGKSGSVKSGNEAFVEEVSKWTFHERGVLHVRGIKHHKEGETQQPDKYRIKDHVVYVAEIAEFHDGVWRPFTANDIQFEAIMLDPYVRTTLKGRPAEKGADSREFAGHFQLPDQYGVFTFKMDYRRRGYTWISAKETISVVQFRRGSAASFLSVTLLLLTKVFHNVHHRQRVCSVSHDCIPLLCWSLLHDHRHCALLDRISLRQNVIRGRGYRYHYTSHQDWNASYTRFRLLICRATTMPTSSAAVVATREILLKSSLSTSNALEGIRRVKKTSIPNASTSDVDSRKAGAVLIRWIPRSWLPKTTTGQRKLTREVH